MKKYFGLGLIALVLGACGPETNTGDTGPDAQHDAAADSAWLGAR